MGGKAALILVMGFSFVLGYISLNLNRIATKAVGSMSIYADMTASNTLAKTGANAGLAKFYQDTTWIGSMTQPSSGKAPSFTVSTAGVAGNLIRLRSVSNYKAFGGNILHDTVEVFFDKNRRQNFSLFAWMTNSENGVSWIDKDTVWGRIHSNGTLTVNGKPVFHEKVTTTKSFNAKPGTNPNYAIFKKGYETGVATVDLPTDLSELTNASAVAAGGKRYTQNPIWVTLSKGTTANGDGKVYVRTTKTGPIIDSISLNNPAFSGVLLGNGVVNLSGTLDGRLTVASLTDVYIQDDVLYQNTNTSTSDDMLGIVAESDVIVANNTANQSNVEIHGSIFTRTGSFMAEDYNDGSPRGQLKVLGSIVQKTRGAVGTFSGSTIQTGYSKRYRYDDRLADTEVRPPFYPGYYVKTYAIKNWWESYRIADLTRD